MSFYIRKLSILGFCYLEGCGGMESSGTNSRVYQKQLGQSLCVKHQDCPGLSARLARPVRNPLCDAGQRSFKEA